ncbi:MAG: bacteriophage abortive infection AbiH family protein [Duncaniella sp.]|nr:bacteriophage abortive infection AbiH family protein [Duncaniella sp.]MDE5988699.1 bacteriophage abortive infection AbiH family protein [Duncaniella sp.]
MCRLYIIGNGFDRHHNINSSYEHFAYWLKKHDRQVFETYRRVCDYDALWCDFERSMAFVSRSYFLDLAMPFLPSLKGREAENLTTAEIFLSGDWGADFAIELVGRLKKRFSQWISSIKTPDDYQTRKIHIEQKARFLTFNYTDFLESQYGIESRRINYIHGKRGSKSKGLIVGHGENGDDIFDQWYTRISKYRPIVKKGKKIYIPTPYLKLYREPTCYIPEYQYLTERIETYYDESRKPVNTIIEAEADYFKSLNDISEIIVLGFSFSTVDLPYINTLITSNKNPQTLSWSISKYNDNDEIRALKALTELGVNPQQVKFFNMDELMKA